MPRGKLGPALQEVKARLAADPDFLRPLVQAVLQELLEAEMTEALGARKGERTPQRLGYRAGYYPRTLVTGSASWSCACRKTDHALAEFARRRLDEAWPYLIVDARYERFEKLASSAPGGAARDRHRLGRPARHPRGRAGQSREPLELAGLPGPAARARRVRR